MKTVGDYAFSYCSGLASVTLNEGLESLGYRAFMNTPVEKIYIPSTLKEASHPFNECDKLIEVTFGGDLPKIPDQLLTDCKGVTAVLIPSSVAAIGNDAFSGTGLTAVTIPASVKTVGDYAFSNCDDLAAVTLNEGLESIGYRAFRGTAITQIDLPSTIVTVDGDAFEDCVNLKKVTAFNSGTWTSIGDNAFSGTALTEIFIPVTVRSIGSSAFSDCSALVITGYEKSYAQTYAEENSIQFVSLGYAPGDVNQDGEVNLKDAVLLRRYIAGGWNATLDETIADVTKDGAVNLKDVVMLRRFIAGGWHIIL